MSLKTIIQQIKSATLPGENTALRVGSALEQMDSAKRNISDSLSTSETIDMLNAVKLLAATGTPFLGAIDPATTIPAGNFWAFASEGTYANAGGIVVGAGDIAIITRVGATFDAVILDVPVKSINTISKTGTAGLVDKYSITYTDGSTPTTFEVKNGSTPSPNLRVWSALPFSKDEQVVKDNVIYIALQNVLATDVPGASSKWKSLGVSISTNVELQNKVNNKALSPEQFFGIIGDYQFSGQTIQLTQELPYAGFALNNIHLNEGIPGGSKWSYADSKYADFERITAVDLYMAAGTFNIFVYAKSNYNTPSETIPVTSSITGIHRHTFSSPINPNTHKIFVSGGVFFGTKPSALGALNIVSGALNNGPTIALGMLLIGEKDVIVNSTSIIDRLTLLEGQETKFSNYLYKKSGSAISDISADTGGGTYTVNSSGLQLNSSGANSGVTLNKQINLSERYLELKVKLKTNTVFYVGTKNVENVVGENSATINCVTKTMITGFNGSTVSTQNIPFDIVNDREYIIRYYKLNNISRLELIDTVTSESIYVQDATTLGQFDKYKFGVSSGSIGAIYQISIISILKDHPFMGFYGDSITEGNSVGSTSKTPYYHDRFANLIGEKLGKPYFVSGRSGGGIAGVLERMKTEIPTLRPNYVFVTVGTNGGNTEANLNQMIAYCESFGTKVILNLIPLFDGSTAGKNIIIQNVVNSRNLMSVKTNVATSVNGDGVTKDNSKFANESGVFIHPNESGNLAIYKRALIDIENVFVEAGVF